jgi:hypothetical protein
LKRFVHLRTQSHVTCNWRGAEQQGALPAPLQAAAAAQARDRAAGVGVSAALHKITENSSKTSGTGCG